MIKLEIEIDFNNKSNDYLLKELFKLEQEIKDQSYLSYNLNRELRFLIKKELHFRLFGDNK